MQNLDDYDIVRVYGAEYRGIIQYYLLAGDVWRLKALRWDAQTSMLKTLAAKHKSSVKKMAARHRAKVLTPYGPRVCCYRHRYMRNVRQEWMTTIRQHSMRTSLLRRCRQERRGW